MTNCPIFLPRHMYEEPPTELLSVGDAIDWGVRIVDGNAGGWPADALVEMLIDPDPDTETDVHWVFASVGFRRFRCEPAVFSLPFKAARMRLGFEADWYDSFAGNCLSGTIRRIRVVSKSVVTVAVQSVPDRELRYLDGWRMEDVQTSPRSWPPTFGWRSQVFLRLDPDQSADDISVAREDRYRVLRTSSAFVGPAPGAPPEAEVIGLLIDAEISTEP